MGPQLVIDKSALQSLSYNEASSLNIYYHVVYTPILFVEILGDLKKFPDQKRSQKEVQDIAKKIVGMGGRFTPHYRFLLYNELMGNEVEMSHRPILIGGQSVITKYGEKAIYYDESPENKALGKWLEGDYSKEEEILSEHWRQSTRALDVEHWLKEIAPKYTFPKVCNYDELLLMTDKFTNSPDRQLENIQFLLSEAYFNQEYRNTVFERWMQKGMPPLKNYSPYAFYCLKVFVAFYLGIANRLIGTKATNRVDLEYVLYLPFCKVFSSTDKFLRVFGSCFLDNNQDFVWGNDLRDDLKRISLHQRSLTDKQKCEYRDKYGCYPPNIDDSITYKLWGKHIGPPKEKTPLTPERERELMEEIKPYLDAIKETRKQ